LSTEFYLVGRVRRAHGIRGELVVEPLTDEPAEVFAPGRLVTLGSRAGDPLVPRRHLQVIRSSPFKGGLIVAFEGLADRSTAEVLREHTLLVPESEITPPGEGEVFLHDLVGMQVVHVNGDAIGRVIEVFEMPQGLIIEVQRNVGGGSVMLPFDEHTVTELDQEQRVIRVDPLEGLLD
jgi:16S rRNA processing protein RimM